MQVIIDSPLGLLGRMLDPNGPKMRVVQLSKAELATLSKAADILEAMREAIGDEEHPLDTDIAITMYRLQEIVEEQGRLDIG